MHGQTEKFSEKEQTMSSMTAEGSSLPSEFSSIPECPIYGELINEKWIKWEINRASPNQGKKNGSCPPLACFFKNSTALPLLPIYLGTDNLFCIFA